MSGYIQENSIHNVDCMRGLSNIPDGSVDLIITSPPYNIGNMKSNTTKHGTYEGNNMKEEDYQKWQKDFLNECHRVLKESGSVFYNHKIRIKKGEAIHPLEWVLDTKFILKQEITWDMGKSANCDKIRFFPFSERVYWLTKSPGVKLFNRNKLSDVWRVVPIHKRKDTGHIAVMPDEIVGNILSAFDKGGLVLDPFAGSGTTLKVAKKLGFKYIGFEISEEYHRLACENVTKQRVEDLQNGDNGR